MLKAVPAAATVTGEAWVEDVKTQLEHILLFSLFTLSFFLLILRSVIFDHYSQVYITYTLGLQVESLHSNHVITVGFFNLHRGWFSLHRG
ncbi:MAG: hypothetical protein N0E48_25875, partial [Candidatus Thiodiazotropha endolucinida]|nr:hypothetical protein [Candidatus Thiodiazotropha taylori]MCW4346754.1 hypothetical protein [Candidatus Thiodiazotropha endolucinida]